MEENPYQSPADAGPAKASRRFRLTIYWLVILIVLVGVGYLLLRPQYF